MRIGCPLQNNQCHFELRSNRGHFEHWMQGKAISGGFDYYWGNYNATITIELHVEMATVGRSLYYGEKPFTGKGHHCYEKEYYVTLGNTYRVVTIVMNKERNRILETATSTSAQVKY